MHSQRNIAHICRGGISTTALAIALMMATPVQAQSDAAALEGHVDGASAGTQVVATDTVTGRSFTGTVDANGNYVILGLRPSTYNVAVDGKPTQQTSILVGQTAVVDFAEAAPADAGSAIVVTGRRLREVRTPTVSTNITPAQIENLPQNQRNFLSFANLAPGVQVAPGGVAQVQAGAVSASNVNVLLDGMSLKNPINHGGVFGQNFGLGNPFPQIAVQEYKIETQNFGAETGQAGSAVLTAVTKTGGQDFHGSFFIDWQPKGFIGQNYFDKKNGVPKPDYDRKQYGGEFGGPIIPGKIHFYAAVERLNEKSPGVTGNVDPNLFPADLVSQVNITHNTDFKQGLYFGKLSFFATDDDTINLSGYIRRENNLTDIAGNATSSHGRTIKTNQDRYQVQWQHNAGDFLNTLNISFDSGEQSTPSVGTGPEYIVSNNGTTDFSEGIVTGAHFFEQGDKQELITFRDDATWRKGEHTFKMGAQVAFMDLSRTVNNSFNGRYYYFNPGPGGSFNPTTDQPYGARINIQPSPTLKSNNTQIGVYFQDEWKPDDHWTINAGLRWDFETNANNNDYKTPAAIAAALRAYPGWAARGIDPEDYISDGSNRKPQWDQIQPRLGVSYDVKGDRDLVFFGGAGRYYDRSLFIAGVIETLTNANSIRTVFFCPSGGPGQGTGTGIDAANCAGFNAGLLQPDALRALAASQGGSGGDVFVLNNKSKMPYSDQFDIGVRKRFGAIQTSATISHIRSHNIWQFVRANFYENGWYSRFVTRDALGNVTGCSDGGDAWIQDFTPGSLTNGDGSPVPTSICAAQNGQLAGFSGKLNRGISNGKAKYWALYLQAEKPFTDASTWGFTTALTIQRARTNDAIELNSDEFFNGAGQDVYGWNHVNGVPKWTWVTSGNYRAPWGIVLSGQLTLNSGPAFGNLQAPWNSSVVVPDGACCYGNFGGALFPKKTIGYKRLDLRLAKEFKTPWGHELSVDFEVFNVFNWLNRNYSTWGAGAGDPAPRTENSQVGRDSRSYQVGLKYSF